MALPLEALDDDLFDVHIWRLVAAEGQLKSLESDSERVVGPAIVQIEIARDCEVATMPPGRALRRRRRSCCRRRVIGKKLSKRASKVAMFRTELAQTRR
jgi:hypothetical protein